MPLPKIEQPLYETTLPISGIKVTYRPYLVKEEKIILLAMQSKITKEVVGALEQIVYNCTEGIFDARSVSYVDLVWLMCMIRGASRGNRAEVQKLCPVENCGTMMESEIDLNKMTLDREMPTEEDYIIPLNEQWKLKLRFPNIDMFGYERIFDTEPEVHPDTTLESMVPLIECIFDDDTVYADFTKEEMIEFIENTLTDKQLEDIQDFYVYKMPKIKVDIPFTCPECGHTEVVPQGDIANFLA